MAEKNSQYKIDFHAMIDGEKYSLANLTRYGRGKLNGPAAVIADIYIKTGRRDELLALTDDSKIVKKVHKAFFKAYRDDFKTDDEFWKWIDAERRAKPGNDNADWWSFHDVLSEVIAPAVMKTPMYQKLENDFSAWLQRRPGIAEAWEKFDSYRAANTHRYYFQNDAERQEYQKPLELNIANFVMNKQDRYFRSLLENSRPLKYNTGEIVKLRAEYLNKKGKDPFRYRVDLKGAVRLGVIAEQRFEKQDSYGVGSREVNVMWFATGEESRIMERCIVRVKEEEMDNVTSSIS